MNKEEIDKFSNDYNDVFKSKIGVYDLESTWEGSWRSEKEDTTESSLKRIENI